MRKRKLTIVLGCLCLLVFIGNGFTAEVIRVGYPAPAGVFLPIWTASDQGFFKKHGLSVSVVSTPSSAQAVAALMANELDVLSGAGTSGVAAQLQGRKELVLFANIINTFIFSVFTNPSITDVSQLRGKKMGVTRFGGTLDFAARSYIKQSGLQPDKDIAFIQVGSMPDIMTALLAGAIDAGTIADPQMYLARKQGLRELADLSKMGARYPLNAFLTRRSFRDNNRPQLVGFVKALTEAIHYLKTHPKEGMEIMSRYTRITDPDVLKPSYEVHTMLFPRVPEISAADLVLVLEEISAQNPKAKEANAADLIDDRIVREVVQSGFVEQLYR